MKLNHKILTLMTALAAGSASAAVTGTVSGTLITNTASADYTIADPSNPSTDIVGTASSNTVTTTVLPKPDFNIVFTDGTADAGTQNDVDTTTKAFADVKPNAAIVTPYTVINNGNTPLTVKLAADETAANASGVTAGTGQVVEYYLADSSGNPTGSAITSVDIGVLSSNSTVKIVQVITIPSTAAPGQVFGASPEGSVDGTGATFDSAGAITGNGYTASTTVYEQNAAQDNNLQFTSVTVYTPKATADPIDGDTTTTNGPTPPTTPVTLPDGTTPDGYTDGTTLIVPDYSAGADNQVAYPKGDANATSDVVTFTNSVTNTGTVADTYKLVPQGVLPTGVTVTFTDMAGNPITEITVAPGETANYKTVVTYPDVDNASTPRTKIDVVIGIVSKTDTTNTVLNTTKDTIYPSSMQFGDADSVVTTANNPAAPVQVVKPNDNFISDMDAITSVGGALATDASAIFLMDVVNNGLYSDTFDLVGTVTLTNADGSTSVVNVVYLDGTGVPITSIDVAAGAEAKVFAIIEVPVGTKPGDYTVTQKATGQYSGLTVTDSTDIVRVQPDGALALAKFSSKSGATAETFTTTVLNPTNGNAAMTILGNTGYTTATTGAKPTASIVYQIIAKNEYNTSVKAFAINDTVPANTELTAISINYPTGGTTIYSTDGSTWSTTAPTYPLAAGTKVYVAIDNAAVAGSQPAPLAPTAVSADSNGNSMEVQFTVTVK